MVAVQFFEFTSHPEPPIVQKPPNRLWTMLSTLFYYSVVYMIMMIGFGFLAHLINALLYDLTAVYRTMTDLNAAYRIIAEPKESCVVFMREFAIGATLSAAALIAAWAVSRVDA